MFVELRSVAQVQSGLQIVGESGRCVKFLRLMDGKVLRSGQSPTFFFLDSPHES